jgi:hypothetical protein
VGRIGVDGGDLSSDACQHAGRQAGVWTGGKTDYAEAGADTSRDDGELPIWRVESPVWGVESPVWRVESPVWRVESPVRRAEKRSAEE